MPCNDGLFEHWAGVPAGSRLEVLVEGNENEFIAFGSRRRSGGTKEPLSHADLHPGPHGTRLGGAVQQVVYSVNVQFTVTAAANARIRARVVKSDGQTFDTPFCQEFSGAHGNTFGCSIGASL